MRQLEVGVHVDLVGQLYQHLLLGIGLGEDVVVKVIGRRAHGKHMVTQPVLEYSLREQLLEERLLCCVTGITKSLEEHGTEFGGLMSLVKEHVVAHLEEELDEAVDVERQLHLGRHLILVGDHRH